MKDRPVVFIPTPRGLFGIILTIHSGQKGMMVNAIRNRRIVWGFKILITLLFIFFVNRKITAEEILVVARHLSLPHCAAALFFSLLGLWFQAKRWEIVLKFQEFEVADNLALKTLLWGNLLAFITPGRVGELFRGIHITPEKRVDSLFAVIIDKLFIVTTVLLTGLICIVLQRVVFHIPVSATMRWFIIVASLMCAAGFIVLSTGAVSGKVHLVNRFFSHIAVNLPRIFTPAGTRSLLYSIGAHAALIAQSVILLEMFGCGSLGVNTVAAGLAYGLMPFYSFTIGNMGVRENLFAVSLGNLGAVCEKPDLTLSAAALGVSVIILVMNLILPALAGLVWYIADTASRRSGQGSGRC
jgi:hypothetical protein